MINGGVTPNQPPEDEFDPFLQGYNPSDLRTASEFLLNWLPFLSKGLCDHCSHSISHRVRSLHPIEYDAEQPHQRGEVQVSTSNGRDLNRCTGNQDNHDSNWLSGCKNGTDINDTEDTNSLGSWKDGANGALEQIEETLGSLRVQSPEHVKSPRPRMSWADMAQEEMDADEEEEASRQFGNSSSQVEETGGEVKTTPKPELSREQRERIRFTNVKRKKDFICLERVSGKFVNILDGLELHAGVFSAVEQKKIVDFVYELQEKGKNGKLKERTYTAPQKWMRGKGRVTIQFGCCYNYATDRNGNPPGILKNELVDPIPHLFKVIIKRLVKWHVLPPTCVPDSCIVNIYDEGDCIPPHIDNHDFLRPFCTVSFLSECNILFGTNLKIEGPGEFSGAFAIQLPVGSVLVLNGNGADIAKHCVPAVPTKRVSITFRKMDESKWPNGFIPEPDLQGLEPLVYESDKPKVGGSYISKPRPSNRQVARRDDPMDPSRGLLGSQPRFYGQSQTRHHGPSPGNRRKARSEY
ncbi:RNA demethylase ALKBH5 isoform X2 [Cynara cardunculus var. scolymus]|uniref:RNA demethylase ALKBH5 isoform X2 n=1 Tax=Cynara cardunculus var. scolymus TaxID=59895 RepID=UPI000D627FF9|nr:RNA demethylase ALKBH5 isoform X2 [Cynara cardunculus var. scolymus]